METYECKLCNYKTNRKYDFNKHLNTKRHKSRKISLSLSSCDQKKSFSVVSEKKTTKSEPNLSPKSQKRQKSEPNLSPNGLRTTNYLSRNGLRKKSQMSQNYFNFPANNKNLTIKFKASGKHNSKNDQNIDSNIYSTDENFENEYLDEDFPESTEYNNHYSSQPNTNNITHVEEPEIFECEYCSLEFKTKPNLKRHQLKSCKFKKEHEEINLIVSLQKDKEKMLEMYEREKEEYRKQIEKLLDKVGTTNITNTNCGNTQTNNVQLNNFGQEDLTMLTDKYMNKMVAYPYSAIPTMIKKIHFNDKYPANRNIRMLNKKDNKLQIRNNGEWQYVNKKETLQLLIEDKNYQLENYYGNNKDKFDSTKQDRFENFQEQVNIEDKKVTDTMKKDTELVFWNSM